MRENFERELRRLHDDILIMGSMVEGMIKEAVDALKRRDFDASRRLVDYDRQVNHKRLAIEHDTLTLIATQQPMAGDMRILAAILNIASELERIGDYAKGIARINLMIGVEPLVNPLLDVPRMADKACDMLHRALAAFDNRDVELATAIPPEDDIVDELYTQVHHELLLVIVASPLKMNQANYLLWVAHNLERVADRVINICERVIYTVTGEMIEFSMGSIRREGEYKTESPSSSR